MKTKHTPGPWRLHYYGEIVGAQEKPGACVTVVCAPNESNPCREANARLIAAAPELLTMLDRLLSEYLTRDSREGHVALLTIEQARAAITKARGES